MPRIIRDNMLRSHREISNVNYPIFPEDKNKNRRKKTETRRKKSIRNKER